MSASKLYRPAMGLFLFLLATFSASMNVAAADLDDTIGKQYYLKTNIWYEKPTKILSSNYHKGSILKAGEKFKIDDTGRKKIIFSDDRGTQYALIHYRKHTTISIEDYFARTFSSEKVNLGKFTELEQKNIKRGEISKGMSKAAVIVAYGYPPEHRTPSLENDRWTYWANRWVSKVAVFEGDKLVSYH